MNNKIIVNEATYEDLKSISNIQSESWKDAFQNILSPKTLKESTVIDKCYEILKSIYSEKIGHLYIARVNDLPCGELFWYNSSNQIEIVSIHVLPFMKNKKIGSSMLNVAMSDIQKLEYEEIFLWVFEKNDSARRFYEKSGFICTNERRKSDYDDEMEIKYKMVKTNVANR